MKKTLLPYILLFFVSLGLIFFWGKNGFTSTGYNEFAQSMDIAWWVKLTYAVDFDQYEQLYRGSELQVVKNQIMTIIIKNLSDRVWSMWAGEFAVYWKKMNDSDYVVVEIWWITDLEQAKEDIWKTVELEFALRNTASADVETLERRKLLAESIYSDVSTLTWSRSWSLSSSENDDVFYQKYEAVTADALPSFYSDRVDLEILVLWELSPLYDWSYNQTFTIVDQSIQPVTDSWFVFFLLEERTTIERKTLQPQIFSQLVDDNNLSFDSLFVADTELAPQQFSRSDDVVMYSNGEILPWSSGLYVLLYTAATWVDVTEIQQTYNETQEIVWAEELTNQWMTFADLQSFVPWVQADLWLQILPQWEENYIVVIEQVKEVGEVLFDVSRVVGEKISIDDLMNVLSQEVQYTLQEVFVNEESQWMPARDPETQDILNGAYFEYASIWQSSIGWYIPQIQFNTQWAEIFCRITRQNVWSQMAIFVDWDLVTSPTIQEEICGWSATINGSYSLDEANKLVEDLNTWTLPAPLVLAFEEKVSPLLWDVALRGALIASVIGIVLIIVVLLLMYWVSKAVTTLIIMFVFLVYLLWLVKLFGVPISLSGIAAIVLSLWMAVDANILIFERIREEIKDGKTLRQAINTWYERSRPPIIDGNISTWLIALVLVFFDINFFSDFGLMILLTIGLVLFVNVPLTKILLHSIFKRKDSY